MTEVEQTSEVAQIINIKTGVQGEPTMDASMAEMLEKAATESIVLLENDGVLPLVKNKKIAVFGRSQLDYFYVGYGSGGEVNAPYYINVIDGLKEKAVAIDETLLQQYQSFSASQSTHNYQWGMWPRFLPELELEEQAIRQASLENDVAMIVIGRAAGEDRENLLEAGSYYLTSAEEVLIQQVTTHFNKVILLINSGNVMDLSWTERYSFSAILFAWQGGMESGRAIANVLVGDISPSGKLPDTIARHYEDYPCAQHFGQQEYSEYVEDIYVGYRYFETFHPEKVLYPFGYGLSYTTFAIESTYTYNNQQITIHTTVTNTGQVAGQEVVQVYYQAPQGVLGKPLRNLIRFAKTALLAPGQSEELVFSFAVGELASYDDSGITGAPFSYVLEAGVYQILVGTSVRNVQKVGQFELSSLQVVERLTQLAAPQVAFNKMVAKVENEQIVVQYEPVTLQQESVKQRVLDNLEQMEIPLNNQPFLATNQTVGALIDSLSLKELDAITRGEGAMDSPLAPKGNAGILGGTTESLRTKGVPAIVTTDGPAGIRLNHYASLLPCGTALASTWNVALVQELGALFGQEMIRLKTDIILAPGMNIHRNPLGGRNFEYYSEDPYLTGKMAAHYVKGVQTNKVAACPKHFACNSQETNRNHNDSRVSERALREIYLRGFEICVKESKPLTLMTSYNKVNGVWSHYHFDLVTAILRNEWGYDGCVMTDWWMRPAQDPNFEAVANDAYRVRAQVDVLMPGGVDIYTKESDDSLIHSLSNSNGLTLKEAQRSAYNVLNLIQKIK